MTVLAAATIGLGLAGCGGGSRITSLTPIPPLAGGSGPQASVAGPAMLVRPGSVEYQFQGTVPDLASHALAYKLGAQTTASRVAELARAFGVGGAVSSDSSGWSATSADLSLQVQASGGLPWTLTNTSGAGSAGAGCAVAQPASTSNPSGTTTQSAPSEPPPTCPPPTTVPGLPSQGEAEQLARSALSRAGMDTSGATVDASGGQSQWYVTFAPSIAGVPFTGDPWSVELGANGTILSASGFLADPTVVGDYPLAGVSTGLERLKTGAPWIVYGGPGPQPMMAESTGASAGGSAGASGAGSGGAPAGPPASAVPPTSCPPNAPCSVPGSSPGAPPASSPCTSAAPCSTVVQPPPTVVTITGVHLGLGWGSPADPAETDAWLVPVYVFELKDGGTISVLAVADSLVSPPTTAPTSSTLPPAGSGS